MRGNINFNALFVHRSEQSVRVCVFVVKYKYDMFGPPDQSRSDQPVCCEVDGRIVYFSTTAHHKFNAFDQFVLMTLRFTVVTSRRRVRCGPKNIATRFGTR